MSLVDRRRIPTIRSIWGPIPKSLWQKHASAGTLRALIDQGIDPAQVRKREKAAARISAENSFERVADEYLAKMATEGRAEATLTKARWFLSLLKPAIGNMQVSEVDPQMLLAALKKLEGKGNYETARKARSFASRVFRFAVATGRAKADLRLW